MEPDPMATDTDDVWELDADKAGSQRLDTAELEREWQTRHNQFHSLGYRDGIEAGKHSTVQEGFDAGHKDAAPAGYRWGVTKGAISAFAVLPITAQTALVPEADCRARLQALHSVINSLSSADALRCYYEDTVQQSTAERQHYVQPEANLADALRSLNISRLDPSSPSNGTHSISSRRLEELERQARTELLSNSIMLSSSNGLQQGGTL